MFTAIIADDEYKIAQLISKLVLWDELGIKLIDITDNGSDALDLIQKYTPDIVITDIRMPEIDGLELIRRVKALGIGTKFVVISGYRYFEYAHSALKYGVEDYLIKPIKQDELNEVLSKICKDKLDYIKNQTNQVMIQEELHKSRNALHRELIEKFITDTISDNDLENVNKLYSLDFSEGLFQTITLMLDHKNLDDRNNRQDNLVIEKLLNLTRQHLKPYVIEVLVSAKDEQIICCILNFSKEQKNKVNNELGSLFTAAEDYIYAFNDYEITMGIGSVETLFSKIHNYLKLFYVLFQQ